MIRHSTSQYVMNYLLDHQKKSYQLDEKDVISTNEKTWKTFQINRLMMTYLSFSAHGSMANKIIFRQKPAPATASKIFRRISFIFFSLIHIWHHYHIRVRLSQLHLHRFSLLFFIFCHISAFFFWTHFHLIYALKTHDIRLAILSDSF